MNRIDNEELDRLIEEAVFENGARNRLQALENEIRRKEQKNRTLRRIFWCAGGAVSAAAAVAAVVVWSPGNRSGNVEKNIYAQTPTDTAELRKPETTSVQPAEEPNQTQISIADKAKNIGKDYLASLEVYRGADEIEREVQKAVQLLKSGNFAEAIDSLKITKYDIYRRESEIDEYDANEFAELMELKTLGEDIEWYLALGYLSAGDVRNAETELKEITAGNSPYRDEAQKILGELHM